MAISVVIQSKLIEKFRMSLSNNSKSSCSPKINCQVPMFHRFCFARFHAGKKLCGGGLGSKEFNMAAAAAD